MTLGRAEDPTSPTPKRILGYLMAAAAGGLFGGMIVHVAKHTHRRPALGDVPTWLAVVAATWAGYSSFSASTNGNRP
jgi:hypothetical protein